MRGQYENRIAQHLQIKANQVQATIRLLDEGNTIPFIARYRKEVTLNLDEFQIRQIEETVKKMRTVDERRDVILASIQEQGKLTKPLQQQIEDADSLTFLEDLYQPYKPKRRTRASIARDAGLQPLADLILAQSATIAPEKAAQSYLSDDAPNAQDALSGARDIVAETISENADIRGKMREKVMKWAHLNSTRITDATDERLVYEVYYEFTSPISRLRPYQVLALNRGESEKVLRIKFDIAERDWQGILDQAYRERPSSLWAEHLALAKQDAAKRLLLPAIERDIRRKLTQDAEQHAIQVFADNLRGLLSQPPLVDYVVMGIDPAYRTGCKVAIVDAEGKVLTTTAIYPHAPQNEMTKAVHTLHQLIRQYGVTLIAIGNGTASRETEQMVATITRELDQTQYLIVNEAGASVYSASDLARNELPDLDVALRGAVSIARRAQDPLAELVKIDPRSIGVGLYQHDINQTELAQSLHGVVESVVNTVGVDVNTASPALLQYVAGIGNKVADNIVAYRDEYGRFDSRHALKKVKGLGAKAYEQAAGFLRVRDGKNVFDNTTIHPESYDIAKQVMKHANTSLDASYQDREQAIRTLLQTRSMDNLAQAVQSGALTLRDILEQLMHPNRDPRHDIPLPVLRSDIMTMDDLTQGQVLRGTVRNCVDFGAFIDIGVKQDGLLHVSKLSRDIQLQVGDVIDVQILTVDQDRGRIGLGWYDPTSQKTSAG